MNFIITNFIYVAIFFISAGMLLHPVIERFRMGDVIDIDGAIALMNREQALLLDIRDADSYIKGSVAQAKHIAASALTEHSNELAKKDCIIVMDSDGKNSTNPATVLRMAGVKRVVILNGGYEAWLAAGLPIKQTKLA